MSVIYPRKPVYFLSSASVVGSKEYRGPLGTLFDAHGKDDRFGKKTWEEAEGEMQRLSIVTALEKAKKSVADIDIMIAGDLLNQCLGSVYGLSEISAPLISIFGACSASSEGLSIASMALSAGAKICSVTASSHNCTAERQFRFPIEYGALKTPTSQWTVTGAASFILSTEADDPLAKICAVRVGKMVDGGITDANNMGAAMAPAAADTFISYFNETGERPEDFDYIFTGDLGAEGSDLFKLIMAENGYPDIKNHRDCGLLMFDGSDADVKCGGSGCGCSACVLSSLLLPDIKRGRLKNILFAATGALMNPTSVSQGHSIMGICHLIRISSAEG